MRDYAHNLLITPFMTTFPSGRWALMRIVPPTNAYTVSAIRGRVSMQRAASDRSFRFLTQTFELPGRHHYRMKDDIQLCILVPVTAEPWIVEISRQAGLSSRHKARSTQLLLRKPEKLPTFRSDA